MEKTVEQIEQELVDELDAAICRVGDAKAVFNFARELESEKRKKLRDYRKAIAKAKAIASVVDEEPPLDQVTETMDRR